MVRNEERGAGGYRGIGDDEQVEGNGDREKHGGGLSKGHGLNLLQYVFP